MKGCTADGLRTAHRRLRAVRRLPGPSIVDAGDGHYVDLGALGVRFMIGKEEPAAALSLVEHPIPPRTLCAPLHRHTREDEYSFVLEGRMGALGDEVVYAEAGELAFKPPNQWRTFWNAGDEPCRILEIISPGGFERYFKELAEGLGSPDFDPTELQRRYAIEFDIASVARICAEHGLTPPLLD